MPAIPFFSPAPPHFENSAGHHVRRKTTRITGFLAQDACARLPPGKLGRTVPSLALPVQLAPSFRRSQTAETVRKTRVRPKTIKIDKSIKA